PTAVLYGSNRAVLPAGPNHTSSDGYDGSSGRAKRFAVINALKTQRLIGKYVDVSLSGSFGSFGSITPTAGIKILTAAVGGVYTTDGSAYTRVYPSTPQWAQSIDLSNESVTLTLALLPQYFIIELPPGPGWLCGLCFDVDWSELGAGLNQRSWWDAFTVEINAIY
ncbi:MAG: hypothetical protein DRH24_18260, partial [Deltaproteobacteria bacterium]